MQRLILIRVPYYRRHLEAKDMLRILIAPCDTFLKMLDHFIDSDSCNHLCTSSERYMNNIAGTIIKFIQTIDNNVSEIL